MMSMTMLVLVAQKRQQPIKKKIEAVKEMILDNGPISIREVDKCFSHEKSVTQYFYCIFCFMSLKNHVLMISLLFSQHVSKNL